MCTSEHPKVDDFRATTCTAQDTGIDVRRNKNELRTAEWTKHNVLTLIYPLQPTYWASAATSSLSGPVNTANTFRGQCGVAARSGARFVSY